MYNFYGTIRYDTTFNSRIIVYSRYLLSTNIYRLAKLVEENIENIDEKDRRDRMIEGVLGIRKKERKKKFQNVSKP